MSVLGYFNSNILGSKLGYITLLIVAPEISYEYFEYPKLVSLLLLIVTVFTVWTPSILSKRIYISLNNMGWLICQLSILK